MSLATEGILIETYNYDELKINFWDFGGQEIMLSTHKFFMSEDCVYIVVVNGRRTEEAKEALEQIRAYGGNSPTFVVVNKIDQYKNADVSLSDLTPEYPFVENKFRVYCIGEGKNIKELQKNLISFIKTTEMYKRIAKN